MIEVFPCISLCNFCPRPKSAKLNSTPNLVDLQYMSLKRDVICDNWAKVKLDKSIHTVSSEGILFVNFFNFSNCSVMDDP